MEAVEGLAASVARHLCHVLWYLVLLRAAFRQPIGCLATTAFIVIGFGAVGSWFQDLQLTFWARKSQKLQWVGKAHALRRRDWPGSSFSPTHLARLAPKNGLACNFFF
jgi:hypothetical protein